MAGAGASMAATALKCVNNYRRPTLLAACAHPLHAVPVGGAVLSLLLTGFFLTALAVIVIDLVALALIVPCRPIRRRLGRYEDRRARKRAAERLTVGMQREWDGLDAVARRTEPFNPRHREVELLLNTFLNVALTHHYASQCADSTVPKTSAAPNDDWSAERARASQRTERAIEALRRQLDATAHRIRLACDLAVAEQCEAGAELWVCELQDCDLPATRCLGAIDPGEPTRK